MIRTILLCGAAFATMALTEPEPIDNSPNGDPRSRAVEWRLGSVIKLAASRGQTLPVEMPPGMEVFSVLVSDQDVMANVVDETSNSPLGNRAASAEGSSGDRRSNDGCSQTANLQVCIRRDRFIFFKPITDLEPQPVSVVMLQPRPGKEPMEYNFLFQIQTQSPSYYGVRVTLAPAPTPARTTTVAAGAASSVQPRATHRPARAATAAPPIAQPVPPINQSYAIEGDRSLLGAPGR